LAEEKFRGFRGFKSSANFSLGEFLPVLAAKFEIPAFFNRLHQWLAAGRSKA